MKNGATVAVFEREFASFVGAKFAIALNSGTSTLHTALVALGVKPGDRVAVPPLTMASTTIAVLHAGAVPLFCDVDERTWLMQAEGLVAGTCGAYLPVSLYGLSAPYVWLTAKQIAAYPGEHVVCATIDDAAQTLRKRSGASFTSYSFQASKILALGEGGMLVTDDEGLATRAREFSSLGYRMRADQPRIDPDVLKSPTFDRHYSLGFNYRMSDHVAKVGLDLLPLARLLVAHRRLAATVYADAIVGCDWLTPQHVPDGWTHDYWTYAVACDTPDRAIRLADEIVRQGGERPYPAWRTTYTEKAFRHLAPDGTCSVAESLQPRLLQMQTNDLASADRNAAALRRAIEVLT